MPCPICITLITLICTYGRKIWNKIKTNLKGEEACSAGKCEI